MRQPRKTAACPQSPKITFPVPKRAVYTAVTPAAQFVQFSAPPSTPSRPNPSRLATAYQPGPPGRTFM